MRLQLKITKQISVLLRDSRFAKLRKIENLFAIIFLVGAFSFALITPPGQNPDESAHFQRVWQLGHFNLFSESNIVNGEKRFGGEIPTNINHFFTSNGIEHKFNPDYKFNNTNLNETHSLRFNEETEFNDFRGAGTYSPVAYISMIPGVWISELLNLPIFGMFYLLRIFSIFAVLAFLYLAIRITPVAKWGFFCVGLIPSVLAQSAAISADGIAMGATILFTSYILYLSFRKKSLNWKNYTLIILLITSIGLGKTAYLPLAALLLLLPVLNKKTREWRTIALLAGTLTIATLPALIWMSAVAYIDSNYGANVNVSDQKDFILSNPLSYLHILYINFFTEQNAGMTPVVWLGLFGNFGYLSAPLPTFAVFLSIICFVCSAFLQSPREIKWSLDSRTLFTYRTVLVSTISLSAVAVATALYIYCSPARGVLIQGLQGRYFVPLLPLISLLFYGNSLKKQSSLKIALPIIIFIVVVAALLAAHSRYYL